MPRELELKLTLQRETMDEVRSLLRERLGQPSNVTILRNTYYDTADAQLNKQKVALRIRQGGNTYTQTLKTKGTSTQGVHDRQEWDWQLAGPELDLGVLTSSPIASILEQSELKPVFATDFQRTTWLWRDGDDAIEFALDSGTVQAGENETPLCEVELELKAGNPRRLMEQATLLGDFSPVFLNPVSKAEQGYWLAGLYKPRPTREENHPLDAWFRALGSFWLTGQAGFLAQAQDAVAGICKDAKFEKALDPAQWQALRTFHSDLTSKTAESARARLLRNSLLGRCQLALAGAGYSG